MDKWYPSEDEVRMLDSLGQRIGVVRSKEGDELFYEAVFRDRVVGITNMPFEAMMMVQDERTKE